MGRGQYIPIEEPEEIIDEEPKSIGKEDLLPRTGKDLPIDQRLVGTTQALFYEFRHQTTSIVEAPYCLKPYDFIVGDVNYRSMYLIYMTCDSEYEAAIKLVGSYPHWQKLTEAAWFKKHLATWNAEITLREDAIARSKLVQLTQKGNVTAARTMLTTSKPAGRPPKEGSRKSDTDKVSDLDEMLQRVDDAQAQAH